MRRRVWTHPATPQRSSCSRRRRRPAFAAGLLALACISLVGAVGCGGGKPEQTETQTTPVKTPEELAAEREAQKLETIQHNIDFIKKGVTEPDANWDRLVSGAGSTKALAQGTKFEKEAAKLPDLVREGREVAAERAYLALLRKAEIEAAKGYWDDAQEVLLAFEQHQGVYGQTAVWPVWQEKCAEFSRASRAEVVHKQILRQAEGYAAQLEYAKAIAVLSAFSDQYAGTPYYERVQDAMGEYVAAYKAAKQEEQAETQDAVFVEMAAGLPGDFGIVEPDPDAEVWSWDEDEGHARGVNAGDRPAGLLIGDSSWDEYVVEFRVRVTGDEPLALGVTSQRRFSQDQYAIYRISDVRPDEWYHLRVEVRNGRVRFIDIEAEDDIRARSRKQCPTGGVGIFCLPGQKVYVKDARYKIYSQIKKEEGSGDGEGEGDASGDDDDGDGDGDGDQ